MPTPNTAPNLPLFYVLLQVKAGRIYITQFWCCCMKQRPFPGVVVFGLN
jgi:hypothetical protein